MQMMHFGVQLRIWGQDEGSGGPAQNSDIRMRDLGTFPGFWDQDEGFGVTARIQGHSWDLGNSDLDSG